MENNFNESNDICKPDILENETCTCEESEPEAPSEDRIYESLPHVILNDPQTESEFTDEDSEKYEKHSKRSLVCGIVGLVLQFLFSCLCCMGLPAIVLGIISISSALKVKKMSLNGKFGDSAFAGFICSLVNIGYFVLSALAFVFVIVLTFIMESKNI